MRYNTNRRFSQDPEIPEAVKQFESLVSDGAGERNTHNIFKFKI